MAVTYATAVKSKRMTAVIDAVDGKTYEASSGVGSAGKLVIGTTALSTGSTGVLVTIPLSLPCATEASGVMTLSDVPLTSAATGTGDAALAQIRSNDGTVIVDDLSVGTEDTDIVISDVSIVAGQTVTVTSGVIAHA